MRMRIVVGLLLTGVVWSASLGLANPSAAAVSREQIIGMLSGYESFPSAAQWRALGTDAVPVLIEIANDGDELMMRRTRAAAALGAFQDARGTAALEAMATATGGPASLRRSALLALAQSDEAKATPVVEKALGSPDPLLRQTAVKALSEMPGPAATELLQAALAAEQEPFLRQQLERAIEARR